MNKKENTRQMGMGVGYVSVMLIFAVICLTIFAVLSLKASLSNESFNERSGDFLQHYYAADTAAKETLSKLNDCAFEARSSGLFDEAFEEAAQEVEGVTLKRTPAGFSVSYSAAINERQTLAVTVVFDNNGQYTIEQWQSQDVSQMDDNSHLGVWDGSF